jgi:hypothetical protein
VESKRSDAAQTSKRVQTSKNKVADKQALRKFLDHLKLDDGYVMIGLDRGVEKETLLGQDGSLRMPGENVMNRLKDETGQSLVIAALAMTCLMGFVALAADVGVMFRERRLTQTAADSGAIAGASQLLGNAAAAARADATLNGFTDGTNGATVAVNIGPSSGPHVGDGAYVEVIVSRSEPTFFMRLFGRTAMTVSGRAVATNGPSTGCIFTLGANPPVPGVDVEGSAHLTLPTCGIVDNATGASALKVGGGAAISATSIGVVGSTSLHNGAVVNPTPITGVTPVSDPLSSLTPPPASDYSTGCLANPKLTKDATIGPASPSGFVCYNGFSITKGSPTITLNPGLYIFNGPNALDIASGTVMNGTGVTFYFINNASFTFSNGATLNASAPTTGSYSGILFYQDPSDSAADSFIGGSTGNINGIFYLPAASLSFENGNSSTFSVDLVVNSLSLSGNAALKPYISLAGTSPISSPRLVE